MLIINFIGIVAFVWNHLCAVYPQV